MINDFRLIAYLRRLMTFVTAVAGLTILQACGQSQPPMEERIQQLESRVKFLESVLAKYEGSELSSPTISSGVRQGIMTGSPPQGAENANRDNSTKQSYAGRCQATTKKGSQCKRTASAGSNYCWQHS